MAESSTTSRDADLHDRSVAELIRHASEQTSQLVRDELRLAQAELREKGKHAGKAAGMVGGAGFVALYGVGAVIAAAILLLAEVLQAWAAALIVGAVLLLVAAVLGLLGRKQVKQAVPPVPEQAVQGVKTDVETIKERARR